MRLCPCAIPDLPAFARQDDDDDDDDDDSSKGEPEESEHKRVWPNSTTPRSETQQELPGISALLRPVDGFRFGKHFSRKPSQGLQLTQHV